MNSDETSNKTLVWGIAAAVGVVSFLLLKFAASYTFWPALLLAVLIAVLVAILVWIGFYREAEVDDVDAQPPRANLPSGTMAGSATGIAAPPTVTDPPATPTAEPEKAAEPKEAAEPAKAAKPKKPAESKKAAKKPTAESAAALMGDAGNRMVAEKKAAKAKPAPAKSEPASKPAAARLAENEDRPELLSAARDGGPDDLKQIKGVGPKLEAELHKMGVYHFDQIASWKKKEVTWMDENLAGVRQRVSRDEWVKQAKILAKGGQTEFSKRVTKGDVY